MHHKGKQAVPEPAGGAKLDLRAGPRGKRKRGRGCSDRGGKGHPIFANRSPPLDIKQLL